MQCCPQCLREAPLQQLVACDSKRSGLLTVLCEQLRSSFWEHSLMLLSSSQALKVRASDKLSRLHVMMCAIPRRAPFV